MVVFLISVFLAATSNCTNFSSRIKNRSVLLNPVATVFPAARHCVNSSVPCFQKNQNQSSYFSDAYVLLLLQTRSGYTPADNPSRRRPVCHTNSAGLRTRQDPGTARGPRPTAQPQHRLSAQPKTGARSASSEQGGKPKSNQKKNTQYKSEARNGRKNQGSF